MGTLIKGLYWMVSLRAEVLTQKLRQGIIMLEDE